MLEASLDDSKLVSLSPEELEAVFIQCIYASLGASLLTQDRVVFDNHVKALTGFLPLLDSSDRLANYCKSLGDSCFKATWAESDNLQVYM